MKYTDLAQKDIVELQKELKEKKVSLFTLKAKQKTMQLKNTNELHETRKDIARILTAINSKRGVQ
ncbi:MAG: large subunit ribosomal protein [Campylobacterota bacterium]|nr:large subunit ribosomal protein [Campylobacterota bacterium]